MSLKSIAVMTIGGDSPGMNAAARAVVRTALFEGVKVWGINNGYHGLLDEDMFEMQSKDVSDIIQRGGTFLGTAAQRSLPVGYHLARHHPTRRAHYRPRLNRNASNGGAPFDLQKDARQQRPDRRRALRNGGIRPHRGHAHRIAIRVLPAEQ